MSTMGLSPEEADALAHNVAAQFQDLHDRLREQAAEIALLNHQIDTWRALNRHTSGVFVQMARQLDDVRAALRRFETALPITDDPRAERSGLIYRIDKIVNGTEA
jgi:hypothetical protein